MRQGHALNNYSGKVQLQHIERGQLQLNLHNGERLEFGSCVTMSRSRHPCAFMLRANRQDKPEDGEQHGLFCCPTCPCSIVFHQGNTLFLTSVHLPSEDGSWRKLITLHDLQELRRVRHTVIFANVEPSTIHPYPRTIRKICLHLIQQW